MMDIRYSTPKKDEVIEIKKTDLSFSPIILPQSPASSSQRNLTGSPRIARDIVADLYNNIQHWNDQHVKGAQIVKNIGIIKSDDPKCYSTELEEYISDLYDIVQKLAVLKDRFESYVSQIWALTKFKEGDKPLFISLCTTAIAELVEAVAEAYINEFKTKTMVLENIAHTRNKDEAMFVATCWTLQPQIADRIGTKLDTLLLETGHRNFK